MAPWKIANKGKGKSVSDVAPQSKLFPPKYL